MRTLLHFLLHFKWSLITSAIILALALFAGGTQALFVVFILAILEVSLSFDNAVVNASVLKRMSDWWQKIFLTVGIVIAVFGMRIVFPLVIVAVTAGLGPVEVVQKAIAGGSAEQPGTYAYLLTQAHPAIAAFGGMFLLMLVLNFFFTDREIRWLSVIEKPLARIGKLDQLSIVVSLIILVVVSKTLAENPLTVLFSGVLGLILYLIVNSLGSLFESKGQDGRAGLVKATGRAGLFLFLYLEVLDASFSFDGVIGAFAISNNIFIIAAGLGIGALFIRSLTVYLVREGTLDNYRYLEHGAHWAIGALALIMFTSIRYEVPEVITGLIGVVFIIFAFAHSVAANRREARAA